jgi:hypothetical protein
LEPAGAPGQTKEEAMPSVLNYMFDNKWIQRADIDSLKYSATRMQRNVVQDSRRIADLEDQVAHLALINEALLRILEKKEVFARDEFRSLLVEVDLEDGVHDGKLNRAPRNAAPKPSGAITCKYCRTENDRANQFCSHCRRPLVRR